MAIVGIFREGHYEVFAISSKAIKLVDSDHVRLRLTNIYEGKYINYPIIAGRDYVVSKLPEDQVSFYYAPHGTNSSLVASMRYFTSLPPAGGKPLTSASNQMGVTIENKTYYNIHLDRLENRQYEFGGERTVAVISHSAGIFYADRNMLSDENMKVLGLKNSDFGLSDSYNANETFEEWQLRQQNILSNWVPDFLEYYEKERINIVTNMLANVPKIATYKEWSDFFSHRTIPLRTNDVPMIKSIFNDIVGKKKVEGFIVIKDPSFHFLSIVTFDKNEIKKLLGTPDDVKLEGEILQYEYRDRAWRATAAEGIKDTLVVQFNAFSELACDASIIWKIEDPRYDRYGNDIEFVYTEYRHLLLSICKSCSDVFRELVVCGVSDRWAYHR